MDKLDFEHTVGLLTQVLPVRAKKYAVRAEPQLRHAGISDRSLEEHLQAAGIHTFQITREAVRRVLSAQGKNEAEADIYSIVDGRLRGEQNPLLGPVRSLLQQALDKTPTT